MVWNIVLHCGICPCISITFYEMGLGGGLWHLPRVNRSLFYIKICFFFNNGCLWIQSCPTIGTLVTKDLLGIACSIARLYGLESFFFSKLCFETLFIGLFRQVEINKSSTKPSGMVQNLWSASRLNDVLFN
jgi:hypothetical protein